MTRFCVQMLAGLCAVTLASVPLVLLLRGIADVAGREVAAVVVPLALITFIFGGIPLIWWGCYVITGRVWDGICSRMS